ncbi:hypothetical protein K1719_034350 [Acacia pycnantha]|nr:hypothetical protein K1719_034350 [Acacia pycnantha]
MSHIFLLEHPNPQGRYNCSKGLATIEEVTEIVSTKYPELQMPTIESLRESTCQKLPDLSSKKLTNAGFEFKCGLGKCLWMLLKAARKRVICREYAIWK